MGTGVLGGMLAATLLAMVFVPLFFRWVSRDRKPAAATAGTGHGEGDRRLEETLPGDVPPDDDQQDARERRSAR